MARPEAGPITAQVWRLKLREVGHQGAGASTQDASVREDDMRIGAAVIIVWLVIGAIAAWQRGYFDDENDSCSHAGNTAVTILVGPLNYIGVNPKVHCRVPQPSK
jgi:hypothetical protein